MDIKKFCILIFCSCLCVFSGCTTGVNDKKVDDVSQSQSSLIISDDASENIENAVDYTETELYDFFNTYGYENFCIDTSDGRHYYNYNNDCVVTNDEDTESIRVIQNNVVYQIWGEQYWDASEYNYDDNPYEIRSVIHIDDACKYYKVGDWYFIDYNNLDSDFYKYKIKDNTITVARVKYDSMKPFESAVLDEVTYTITELKNKSDMPEVDLGVLEKIVVQYDDYDYTESDVTKEESSEVSVPSELLNTN